MSLAQGDTFAEMWTTLEPLGRASDGSYHRLAWSEADLACRDWFRSQARQRNMALDEDRNGNLWAWWGEPGPGAVVTGSHLDSVPGGGAFDGPLGVVSGFAAVDRLSRHWTVPPKPLAVVDFADEEGGRFGVACAGSRLMTGQVDPDALLARTDRSGVTLAEAMRAAGFDPTGCGEDPERISKISAFVELHIEQGRALDGLGAPVGVAAAVWPHGRWRFDFAGQGDHAGTTRLADRRDPLIPVAHLILDARAQAGAAEALATVGRVEVNPGATNAVASRASAWLDARAPSRNAVRDLVESIQAASLEHCKHHDVALATKEESWSDGADFPGALQEHLIASVAAALGSVPKLTTGAGHDAAILAARVPTAMLFVRNPTGISHDPAEAASMQDCLSGVDALTAALSALLDDPRRPSEDPSGLQADESRSMTKVTPR